MAQQKRNTGRRISSGRSSGGRSASGRKQPGKSRTSSGRTSSGQNPAAASFADWFHAFSKTRIFVPVAVVAVLVLLILLDLLLSWNNYDRFFKILGFELLLAGIVWVIGLVLSFGDTSTRDASSGS